MGAVTCEKLLWRQAPAGDRTGVVDGAGVLEPRADLGAITVTVTITVAITGAAISTPGSPTSVAIAGVRAGASVTGYQKQHPR